MCAEVAHAEAATGIYLLPLGGGVPDAELELARRALEAVYSEPVKVLANVELPRSAFYPPRSRYRAEKLLEFVRSRLPSGALRIAGITAVDISTTKPPHADWGILGLATIDGSACVLSTFRCHRRAKDAEHARVRFAKTAVHELGHTFGLDLCTQCRTLLARKSLLRLPPGALPW